MVSKSVRKSFSSKKHILLLIFSVDTNSNTQNKEHRLPVSIQITSILHNLFIMHLFHYFFKMANRSTLPHRTKIHTMPMYPHRWVINIHIQHIIHMKIVSDNNKEHLGHEKLHFFLYSFYCDSYCKIKVI